MRTTRYGEDIRPPAVAGSFYPADPGRLRGLVAEFLAAAPAYAGEPPEAVIAPHAGYVYSGPVAPAAFASLREKAASVVRAVLIGPAHYVAVHGVAISPAQAFETPLGRVGVDRDALAAIADLPWVTTNDRAHAPEHALEVELPFLQVVLGAFALVPLLVGDAA